jgi:hypothetical protein
VYPRDNTGLGVGDAVAITPSGISYTELRPNPAASVTASAAASPIEEQIP